MNLDQLKEWLCSINYTWTRKDSDKILQNCRDCKGIGNVQDPQYNAEDYQFSYRGIPTVKCRNCGGTGKSHYFPPSKYPAPDVPPEVMSKVRQCFIDSMIDYYSQERK